jgi:diacylglycerol kinase family enzyme
VRAVAIVNGTARRLRGRVRAEIERALPGGVRMTRSLDHAREVVREEVRRGVDLIVLGGGDGTVMMGLALIAEACRGAAKPEPAIGTGNAIADALGASHDPAGDVARLARGEGTWRELAMLDVLGVRAPFVGLGLDALMIEDHEAVGSVLDRLPGARRLIPSSARYALSVGLRSIPRFAIESRPLGTVTNIGAPATEMSRNGPTGKQIASGDRLWTGRCTLVAGSTIPYFGFGLKMFAFSAARPDRFHLRCADPGLLESLASVPAAFRGDYFSDRVHDFLCERVAIELDREAAIEAGGELLGRRKHVDIALAAPVRVVALG